jgi:hypothetical protein
MVPYGTMMRPVEEYSSPERDWTIFIHLLADI